jgi:hypothetical protein
LEEKREVKAVVTVQATVRGTMAASKEVWVGDLDCFSPDRSVSEKVPGP